MAAPAAAFDPMAQKIARLKEGNEKIEREIIALRREANELNEEHDSMVRIFQEELKENSRVAHEEAARADAAADLLLGYADVDGTEELSQLEDELDRARRASTSRAEQWMSEVAALRAKLTQRRQQVQRTKRVSRVRLSSAEADKNEASELRARALDLGTQIEEFEATCIKLRCQAEAWQGRREEVRRQSVCTEELFNTRMQEVQIEIDKARSDIRSRDQNLEKANRECDVLKLQLLGTNLNHENGEWPLSGSTPMAREFQSPCTPPIKALVARGVQTQYISEHSRLREQAERLHFELQRQRSRQNTEGRASAGSGLLRDWFSLCLRPRFEAPSSLADRAHAGNAGGDRSRAGGEAVGGRSGASAAPIRSRQLEL